VIGEEEKADDSVKSLHLFIGDEEDYVPRTHTDPSRYEPFVQCSHAFVSNCLQSEKNNLITPFSVRVTQHLRQTSTPDN